MTDESILAAALAIGSPSERAAYLDHACADNPALRAEVEQLLAAHAADNPLDRPPANLVRTGAYEPGDDGPPAAAVGDRIGPYRLMEQIGEGGFGLVFVAEQTEPVRRKVALKVLKPGMDTKDVVARFEAERQALALMDHPNIAKVLDAGSTPQGRPFFVMELVRGVPITDYCDQHKLPPRERLTLFALVCQAVQHAHQKGVIHRDLKPSNILVTSHDGVPVPKVIDFGVAKAVGQRLTEKTIYTRFAQMIGTPLYMSPEQAEMSGLDVDTRSDVYALGVLLYELLTGTTPFDRDRFRKAAFDEIRRIIREEEPPRPSTRFSASATLAKVAAARNTDPTRLSSLVRGELDWIVMKALEKDRERRYDSANGLAKDVQRYLNGDAVEACPPTLGYRLRKFYRRNRVAVWVATAFLMVAYVGVMGIYFAYQRAVEAEGVARSEKETAEDERGKAEAARRAAERTAMSLQIDLDLAECQNDRRVGLLGLARTLKTIPPHYRELREFVTASILLGVQRDVPLRPPITHDGAVLESSSLSPDGRTLLTLGRDDTARLWEFPNGKLVAILRRGDERVVNLGFSPDGKSIFTDSRDGIARLWNAPEGTYRAETAPRPYRYDGPPGSRWERLSEAVSISNDRLLTANVEPSEIPPGPPVELWDTRTGRFIARLDTSGPVSWVDGFRFFAGGRWIIGRWDDSTVLVFSARDGRLAGRLEHPKNRVSEIWTSPGGRWVVTGAIANAYEQQYRFWDTESWRLDFVLSQNTYDLHPPRFLGEDAVAITNAEGSVTVYQPGRAEPIRMGHVSIRSNFATVGELLLGNRGEVVSTRTWQRLMPPRGRRYHPDLVRLTRDGRFALADYLIDTATDKEIVTGPTPQHYRQDVGFISNHGSTSSQFMPNRLDIDPELVELWLQVAFCGELDPDGRFVKLEEETWEQKRRELASRPAPYADFPFPSHVASDRLRWLRREFAAAPDVAGELRLARELLRRAEAMGDRDEAERWRDVVEPQSPAMAPMPREVKR